MNSQAGLNVLSGRRGLLRIRAAEKSELIEIDRETLQILIETDTELSDIFLRAYILRRLELIARGFGDIVLIDSSHSLDVLRIKEFLTRNYQPYSYIDLERGCRGSLPRLQRLSARSQSRLPFLSGDVAWQSRLQTEWWISLGTS